MREETTVGKEETAVDKAELEGLLPYYLQRVNRFKRGSAFRLAETPHGDWRDNRKGIDACFEFDYMGSAEFEFGALPKSVARMREYRNPPAEVMIEAHGKKAFFVGPVAGLGSAEAVLEDQLGPQKLRFKEITWIKESYAPPNERCPRFIGWWAIDEHRPNWAMFANQDDAKLWKRLVYDEKPQLAKEEKNA